jgi:hypothetical protein
MGQSTRMGCNCTRAGLQLGKYISDPFRSSPGERRVVAIQKH